MDEAIKFTPLIIIGAGRSGTNILRDTLCNFDGFTTWDCDEINPIWRHGNLSAAHDEFDAAMATTSVKKFIRGAFHQQWLRSGKPQYIVEKTCANSLRIPFIAEIFPEAKFLFIVRDGVDVLASAKKRWRGEMEVQSWPYYWAKIRHTPMLDLPIYGGRFIKARAQLLLGDKAHMSFWGPQFADMASLDKDISLDELCVRQWRACVEKAQDDLEALGDYHSLKYEDLTADPRQEISNIMHYLGEDIAKDSIEQACASVHHSSVGKGRGKRPDDAIMQLIGPTLQRFGYER